MNHPKLTIWRFVGRKLAVMTLLFVSAAGAFATLGDGKKSEGPKNSLYSSKAATKPGFTLRSGYSYRGNQLFSSTPEKRYIQINKVVTMQKGNTTYIVPLKKKVILQNVKIQIGNRQFQRN